MKVEEIIKAYGINTEPKQIYSSAWDVDDKYVLKKYTNIHELKRNIEIIRILSEENIPVQKIVMFSEEKEYFEGNNEYWILTTKLKGSNVVNVNECDNEWFFHMGVILAELHLAFDKCEDRINYWNNSLLGEMESWALENISKQELDYLRIEDVCDAIKTLKDVYVDLPKGLIHRDVHLGNFLFANNKFSGYIDFDLSQKNIRIFDLCYFMLGLLLEEEENRVDENKWFEYLKWIVKGYDSKITLSKIERDSIAVVMENIELLFVGYFIGEQEDKAARESAELFYFCKRNEEKIRNV